MANILVPLDGSPVSEEALSLARQLASTLGGTLELVHVVEPVPLLDLLVSDRNGEAERYLARVAEGVAGAVPVRVRVLDGDPVTELLRCAHQAPDSLIVMATHRRAGLSRLLLGSVADKVVRGATVPVVVVRQSSSTVAPAPRRLLVPLDGSVRAEAALPLAARLGREGAAIALVRVIPPQLPWAADWVDDDPTQSDPGQLDRMVDEARLEARSSLAGVARDLRRRGLSVTWEVRLGRPGDEIVRAAETTGADLVLMATTGAHGSRRWSFGSVTDEVLRRSRGAVLVVPPRTQPEARPAPEPSGWARRTGGAARPRALPALEQLR